MLGKEVSFSFYEVHFSPSRALHKYAVVTKPGSIHLLSRRLPAVKEKTQNVLPDTITYVFL